MRASYHLRRFSGRHPTSLLALMLLFVLAQSVALVCCIPCATATAAGTAEGSARLAAAAPDKAADIGDSGRCTDCASCSVLAHAAPPVVAVLAVAAVHDGAIVDSTVRSPRYVPSAIHFSSRAPPLVVV